MQFTKNCKCELLRPSVMHDWLQIMRNDNTQVTTRQRIVFGRPFVKRFALCYRTVVLPVLSVCNVGVLWPNGRTDQDETWHAGRPRPWSHCVRWGPSSPPSKMHSPPIFGPCLLWPKGWMEQDTTWCGNRPWPRRHCARWGPSSPQKRAEPPIFGPYLLWPTAGWIKMPLGIMEVAWRSPSSTVWPTPHTVLDGDPALPLKRGHSPHFRPMSIVVKRSPISATAEHL